MVSLNAVESFSVFDEKNNVRTEQNSLRTGLLTIGSDILTGLRITTRHGYTILSIAAISVTALILVRPEMASHLTAASPFAPLASAKASHPVAPLTQKLAGAVHSVVSTDRPTAMANARQSQQVDMNAPLVLGDFSNKTPVSAATQQQALVTKWLAKKYRVAGDATHMLVSAAYTIARETKLDPLLILSVMAIESGFNPFAESPVGAQGLMQVMSKIHHEKFQPMGGVKAALNPVANIRVGSLILKDYVKRGGSLEAGLKMYVGAAAFDTDFGYGSKVMAEYQRLKQVALGKPVPTVVAYVAKSKPTQSSIKTSTVSVATTAVIDDSAAMPTAATPKSPQVAKSDSLIENPEKVAGL